MKILIDIGHPAHVHYYKNFAWEMQKKGHKVFFTTVEKEFEPYLLEKFGFNFKKIRKHRKGLAGKIMELILSDFRLLFYSFKIKPDMFLGAGSISAAHVAFLLGKPFIQLEDTGNMEQIRLYRPFTTLILTPDVLQKNLGKKQFRYKGYQEICYLHPDYYKPDHEIYKYLGIPEESKFALLRFVSWNASHDKGQKGISYETKRKIVDLLEKHMHVFISSESDLPDEFQRFKIRIMPHQMHDVLYYADIFIGEGATMASEAGLLGTPSFYINSIKICYNLDQESYGTVFNFNIDDGVIEKVKVILKINNVKSEWKLKSEKIFQDKINVTAFLIWFVENYPGSLKTLKNDPDYQLNFK
jgi:predicted glycosyltransferase